MGKFTSDDGTGSEQLQIVWKGTWFVDDSTDHAVRKLTPVSLRFTAAGLANAASFAGGNPAAAQIVSLFGEGLAGFFGPSEGEQGPSLQEEEPRVAGVQGEGPIDQGRGLLVLLVVQMCGDGRLEALELAPIPRTQFLARLGLER